MGLIRFIFSKFFVINVAVVGVLALASVVGLFYGLEAYTEHGITVNVPDFSGLELDSIESFVDSLEIEVEIVDSLYSNDYPRGTVADQEPKPGMEVKRGRTIYLTVNAILAQQVKMPDLNNLSFRQAKAILETFGLGMGNLEYVPDIAKNAVLDQKIDGVSVKQGTQVFKGTVVDLVLGDGLSNTRVPIPYLKYLKLSEATERLQASSFNIAAFKMDTTVTDTGLARVYNQIPQFSKEKVLPMGTSFILYLTQDTLSIEYDSTLYTTASVVPDTLLKDDLNNDFEGFE